MHQEIHEIRTEVLGGRGREEVRVGEGKLEANVLGLLDAERVGELKKGEDVLHRKVLLKVNLVHLHEARQLVHGARAHHFDRL